MSEPQVVEEPFPAPTRQASGVVDDVLTEVSSVSFEDKILVTLSQDGRLSQWVRPFAGHVNLMKISQFNGL